MKKLALTTIIGCSLAFATLSATARASTPERDGRGDYRLGMTWPWSHGLKEEVNHLNRMRGHVRWQLRNYRGNREIRRDFARVSRDIDQINSQFKSSSSNRGHLRHDVEKAHAELHHIETALHVKPRDFYPWR
jgi:hypothetical protein